MVNRKKVGKYIKIINNLMIEYKQNNSLSLDFHLPIEYWDGSITGCSYVEIKYRVVDFGDVNLEFTIYEDRIAMHLIGVAQSQLCKPHVSFKEIESYVKYFLDMVTKAIEFEKEMKIFEYGDLPRKYKIKNLLNDE